ncbi:MAG TPA: hypothetical protein VNF73_09765 [Candidatus Saccharimonadales bacterium]|nr:hypothetical protein [Candidatus Saccharimonadales bacterium]
MTSEIPARIAIEPIFVIEATYATDAARRRPPVRAEHLTRIGELIREGRIIEAGGYLDLSTAILLVRAKTEEEALALIRDDVYTKCGVLVSVRAKQFGRVVPTDV